LDVARTRIRSGRFAAAAGALADLPGDDPQAPHLLGVCRLGAGQPQAALALFDAALRLNPDAAAARLLPADPAPCARFHLQTTEVRTVSRHQVRQPVNARGIGRWRPYADHLAPLIAELAAAGLADAPGEGPSQ